MTQLTGLTRHNDIISPYKALMEHLDKHQFKDKMKTDESLWVKEEECDSSEYLTTEQYLEQEIEQMLID